MSSSELAAIEETMTEIRRNWNVMLQDQFNPIMVALEMLQKSNSSHDFETFMRLNGQLDEAMAVIVERYYTGFKDAVSIFGGIVDNTNLSRDIAKKVVEGLDEFQQQVQYQRVEIPELWSKVQQYKGTFAATGKLEQVNTMHAKALVLSERKFFIPAARLLMSAIYDARYVTSGQLADSSDICKILESSRNSMFDTIVDELHRLLYLKNENSLHQLFAHLLVRLPEVKTLNLGGLMTSENVPMLPTGSDPTPDVDLVLAPSEFDFDPTIRVVTYLGSLIKASAILECLPTMLTIITQRMVSELYLIGDKCIATASKEYRRGLGQDGDPQFVPVLKGTMDKVQSREFDMFVPVLRRLCSTFFGKLLIIANVIRTIGEAVNSIAKEAGIPLDIYAFEKNCLGAIHGEIKNFLVCVLQGGKTVAASRIYVNSTVAITDALKGGNKKSDGDGKKKKAPLYHFVNIDEGITLEELPDNSSLLKKKEESAARKLAQMLAIDPFSTFQQDAGHQLPASASLQYLPVIYRPFGQLETWLQTLFTSEQVDVRFVDSTYLENLISEQYIPAIESYTAQELTRAFNSADALFSQELIPIDQALAIGKGATQMLNCITAFASLFLQISCILHQVPGCQAECEQLLTALMGQFLEKCDAKFRELVTSKATEDPSVAFIAISSHFVSHEEVAQLLSQHSMLRNGAEEEEFDRVLAEKEILLLERLKSDRSLHRNEVIFDHRILRSIALLQRSLELLPQILSSSEFGILPGFPQHRPEFKSLTGDGQAAPTLHCLFFDGVYRGARQLTSNFETQFKDFTGAIQRVADTCLFLLRLELRVHCFYYLDLAYREGRYDFDEPSDEPDPYVVSLANDLFRFESLMIEWLPYSRYHFVMDELNVSLGGMLVSAFRYIRALQPAGCHKLISNVAALEQILSLINTDATDTSLEMARQFYHLVSAGPEKFIELAITLPCKFTLPQYQSIFDVYYRDQAGEGSLRKTYANQLIRLKYLLEKDPKSPLLLANNDTMSNASSARSIPPTLSPRQSPLK